MIGAEQFGLRYTIDCDAHWNFQRAEIVCGRRRLEIRRSGPEWRVNREIRDDFWRYTHTDENSDRVGEFAIGTNIELKDVIGHILQDEKFPGVHIAFGNPYGAHTGAEWYSATHIDVVGRQFDIWVDDEQIMRQGKFLFAD